MKTFIVILALFVFQTNAFADSLIIDRATRIVARVTSESPPNLNANEDAVSVPNRFDIGNGPWKLSADNITLVRPTQADLDAYDDILNPSRVTERQLFQAIEILEADPNNRPKLVEFLRQLKEQYR